MKPKKTTELIETPLASKIVAAVQAWQQQMPAEASLAEYESGAQQLAFHVAQLAYDKYLADGLPIGSGAIEGACKHLVASRCKQAGMRWSTPGLDALSALRCQALNEQLDTLLTPPKLKLVWDNTGALQLGRCCAMPDNNC